MYLRTRPINLDLYCHLCPRISLHRKVLRKLKVVPKSARPSISTGFNSALPCTNHHQRQLSTSWITCPLLTQPCYVAQHLRQYKINMVNRTYCSLLFKLLRRVDWYMYLSRLCWRLQYFSDFDPNSRTMSTKQTSKVMYTSLSFQERRGDKDVQIYCVDQIFMSFSIRKATWCGTIISKLIILYVLQYVVVERAILNSKKVVANI